MNAQIPSETGLESTAPPKSGEEGRCPFAKCWGRIYIDATAQADMAELQGRMNAERQTNLLAAEEIKRLQGLIVKHNMRAGAAELKAWIIDFSSGALVK